MSKAATTTTKLPTPEQMARTVMLKGDQYFRTQIAYLIAKIHEVDQKDALKMVDSLIESGVIECSGQVGLPPGVNVYKISQSK